MFTLTSFLSCNEILSQCFAFQQREEKKEEKKKEKDMN